MKKIYIYQFDNSALSPLSALGFSEKAEPPDGFQTYAVFESSKPEQAHAIISECVGWSDNINGVSISAQRAGLRSISSLRDNKIDFTCKMRQGYGENPSPIEVLSFHILDENL